MTDSHSEQERAILSGLAQDTGRYLLGPIFFQMVVILLPVLVYGVIRVVSDGFTMRAAVMLLGPVVSLIALVAYPQAMYLGRSWLGALCALSGFLPYLLGLYLVIIEGVGRLISLFSGFSVATLFAGVFWVFIGWVFSYKLWYYTEAVKAAEQARKRVIANRKEK
jgi:hypothetical protein